MPATDPGLVQRAVDILRGGGLVAYPTDTVYGLAVLPGNEQAVARLFEAKRRNSFQPMPLLIASEEMAPTLAASVSSEAQALMAAFWPGALTIILAKAQTFRSLAVGETVGLRVPDHPLPGELSRLLGSPITGTSANSAGGAEPLTADDVRAQLGDAVDLVIDGGRCSGGRPSTVVDCTASPPRIVRQGAISEAALLRVLDWRS